MYDEADKYHWNDGSSHRSYVISVYLTSLAKQSISSETVVRCDKYSEAIITQLPLKGTYEIQTYLLEQQC